MNVLESDFGQSNKKVSNSDNWDNIDTVELFCWNLACTYRLAIRFQHMANIFIFLHHNTF